LRQPRIRLTRGARKPFLPFLIFRIFEILIKKRKKKHSHTEFCVEDVRTCANKAATNVCVCVCLQQDKEKVQSFGLFLAPGELKEIQKKQKREKVVEGQLE
jgi:hypothetical protein